MVLFSNFLGGFFTIKKNIDEKHFTGKNDFHKNNFLFILNEKCFL